MTRRLLRRLPEIGGALVSAYGRSGMPRSVVACHMTMGLASGDLGFTPSG
ncbi:predicted protein [Plenodomus lingam JN3]|uniref:Predicted protein n=1 Tax=Leptosphaeria maculans (strain JN3 / isolate v23.1.3 / race Av1-4-5-6-7-8) TaxID=985895 RepID=E5AAK5_LEPMJ|nr:predicted protein [Plenodomus lingam JN3]CBY00696.1 predicted protein [Plenodomus lingam JN3]